MVGFGVAVVSDDEYSLEVCLTAKDVLDKLSPVVDAVVFIFVVLLEIGETVDCSAASLAVVCLAIVVLHFVVGFSTSETEVSMVTTDVVVGVDDV